MDGGAQLRALRYTGGAARMAAARVAAARVALAGDAR